MTTLLTVLIYLVGSVCGYLMYKKYWTNDGEVWTIRNRRNCIISAILLSWVMALVYFISYVAIQDYTNPNSDKPASW